MGDKVDGGDKNLKEWVTSFTDGPLAQCATLWITNTTTLFENKESKTSKIPKKKDSFDEFFLNKFFACFGTNYVFRVQIISY